jgi:hypothetical protein
MSCRPALPRNPVTGEPVTGEASEQAVTLSGVMVEPPHGFMPNPVIPLESAADCVAEQPRTRPQYPPTGKRTPRADFPESEID